MSRREEVQNFLQHFDIKDKRKMETSLQNLENVSIVNGLNSSEIEDLTRVLTSKKLASSLSSKLFRCLIPETLIPHEVLSDLLSWYFSLVSTGEISKQLEKQFIHWITGIAHYELGDRKLIDSYYLSFFFLLWKPHMETVISKLLCLISKPEDAKRWRIKKILNLQRKSASKAPTNALLSILKSFRPDIVPENVPMIRMNIEKSAFQEPFQKAHDRMIESDLYQRTKSDDIFWDQFRALDKKSSQLMRLVPTAEKINFEPSTKCQKQGVSVMDIKNMNSLGSNILRLELPTQSLSLLNNIAGYHILAFSDIITKSRFCHKLHHTLFRVFILELEPYSEAEKVNFLNSVIALQEYIQQGIPVVTQFLIHYLLIWDGDEFREQIFSLLQWVLVENASDWEECFFRPLRQIFRSSGAFGKYLMIGALESLLRNILTFHGRKDWLFSNGISNLKTVEAVKAVVDFANELMKEGLIWSYPAGRRDLLTASLNFYEVCSTVEYSEKFPAVLVPPPALVYGCLFSESRICITRFCSLLVRLWQNSVQKLLQKGCGDDFNVEIQQIQIFMLDYYRCLWSNIDFQSGEISFMLQDKDYRTLLSEFEKNFGIDVRNIFATANNTAFWCGGESNPENFQAMLSTHYSPVIEFKILCEEVL